MTTKNTFAATASNTAPGQDSRFTPKASSSITDALSVKQAGSREGNRLIALCLIVMALILLFVRAVDVNSKKRFAEGYRLGYQAVNSQFVERELR